MKYLLGGLAAVFFALFIITGVKGWLVQRELYAVTFERDRIAADAAAERRRADGWEVKFGEEVDLSRMMEEEKDSAIARLSRDYRGSQIEVHSLTELLASATGELESVGERTDSSSVVCEGRWEGEESDDLLRLFWDFTLPKALHSSDYLATIPGELLQGVTGDGRWIFSARSLHPRAELNIPSVFVDPPEPEIRYRTKKKLTLVISTLALLSGYILGGS